MGDSTTDEWPASTFLAGLAAPRRAELLRLGTERRYDRGETILNQGDLSTSVLFLIEGVTKISTVSAYGDESLLSLRTRGDLLGEMAFATGSPRTARVVAATPVRARVLAAAEFSAFLDQHPETGLLVAGAVARKLQRANERRAEFHSLMARARVAAILVEAARTIGRPVPEGLSIGPELTQADLASLASVSLSTFEKVLLALENEHLAERRRRALIITRPDELQQIAGFVF
ncbi:MAG TPA: Crp/Fnr family transcriptional regulator [Actinocrinis sp.]|nr:Crp/Fnr family transcriptional regulator [Actinocrinis sp.]